jgi:metal-responsive CopG/Arc/MetJ family transcriptional regulator
MRLPESMIERLDKLAEAEFITRSKLIYKLLLKALKKG